MLQTHSCSNLCQRRLVACLGHNSISQYQTLISELYHNIGTLSLFEKDVCIGELSVQSMALFDRKNLLTLSPYNRPFTRNDNNDIIDASIPMIKIQRSPYSRNIICS